MKVTSNMMTLYAVTDSNWVGKQTLLEQVKDALEGGITFLQLREKNLNKKEFLEEAIAMRKLANQYQVPFVVNDDLEIAIKSGADGVHVGQDDLSVEEVRKIVGDSMIVGVSTHNVEEAIRAQSQGADYLGLGAIYTTTTKKDANVISHENIRKVCDHVSIPIVGIGGIKKDNIMALRGSHIDGVAMISAIFGAENIKEETEELLAIAKEMKGY